MKKYILLLLSSFIPSLHAQVGINTSSPKGVFNILKSGGSLSAEKENIMVDVQGNLGVGITNPDARLDIKSTSSSLPALRIEDGVKTQKEGRVLMSDVNGAAHWGDIKGSGGGVYKITAKNTYNANPAQYVLPLTEKSATYPITNQGNYLFVIEWNAIPSNVNGVNAVSCYFFLKKGYGTPSVKLLDTVEYYAKAYPRKGFSFTTTLAASDVIVGDVISLEMLISVGGGSWTINQGSAPPSITILKL